MGKRGLVFGAFATLAVASAPSTVPAAPISGNYDVTFSVFTNGSTFSDGPNAAMVGSTENVSVPVAAFTSGEFASFLGDDGTLNVSMFAANAGNFGYPTDVTIALTNVDLADAGVSAPIANVVFDAAMTDIDQFADAADFSGPTVNFTDDSITIDFTYDGAGIAADGPPLFFDISLETAAMPLPATAWLLAIGVGALAVGTHARRRAATGV